jgi:uncharacterized protein DUF4124
MKPILLCAVLLAICTHASAQQLYKCKEADGKVTYQSQPCPEAAKEDRVRAPGSPGSPAPVEAAKPASGGSEAADPGVVASAQKACLDDIMKNAKTYWDKSVQEGTLVAEFPEGEFRESGGSLCACLAQRAKANVSPAEFKSATNRIMSKYMKEAIEGGECKPTGIVGVTLRGVR